MSRIGNLHIDIPAGVTVTVAGNQVTVKGPKGELSQEITGGITLEQADGKLTVVRPSDDKEHRSLHGVGVGYRAESNGQVLNLTLGYSHAIYLRLPKEVKVETKSERNKNPLIILESCDKQLLGQICAKIRTFRKPEPYKGKGIRFVGEVVRRKSGKSAGAK